MINILLLSAVILLSIFGVGCGMDHFGIDHRVECQDKSENVQKIRVAHNSENSEFETINFDLAKLYSPPDILERFKPSMQIEFHYTLFISVIEGNRYFHLSEPQPNTFQVPSFNEPKPSHFKSVEALVQFLKMHPKAKIFNIVLGLVHK